MAKPLLSDELWDRIRQQLPTHPPGPKGGRPRLDDRRALTGVLFVLKTGIPWEALPAEMGCGCGMTCWRRLREWRADGSWSKIRRILSGRLPDAGRIDWDRASVDPGLNRSARDRATACPTPAPESTARRPSR